MYIVTSKPNLSSMNSGFVQVIAVSLPQTFLSRLWLANHALVKAYDAAGAGPLTARDALGARPCRAGAARR